MTMKKFNYKGTEREVIITEESDTSLKGYDVSKLDKEDQKEVWRELAKNTDMSKLTEEQQNEEYKKFKYLMKYFRHFKKSEIK